MDGPASHDRRSSAFLSLAIGLAWRTACASGRLMGLSNTTVIASSCWVAGLATLLEKKSRRMELSLYALSRAIESFFLCIRHRPLLKLLRAYMPRRMDVVSASPGRPPTTCTPRVESPAVLPQPQPHAHIYRPCSAWRAP